MVITTIGCPGVGSGLFSIKLALNIVRHMEKTNPEVSIVIVNGDYTIPTTPIYNPNSKYSASIGGLIAEEFIDFKAICRHLTPYEKSENIGLLSYKYGENAYSYPEPTESKAEKIMTTLRKNVDFVLIDAVFNFFNDPYALWGFTNSETFMHLFSPTPKALSYETSQNKILTSLGYSKNEEIKIFSNITDFNYTKLDTYKKYYGDIKYVLPHSQELAELFYTGELDKKLTSKTGKEYDKVLDKITISFLTEQELIEGV